MPVPKNTEYSIYRDIRVVQASDQGSSHRTTMKAHSTEPPTREEQVNKKIEKELVLLKELSRRKIPTKFSSSCVVISTSRPLSSRIHAPRFARRTNTLFIRLIFAKNGNKRKKMMTAARSNPCEPRWTCPRSAQFCSRRRRPAISRLRRASCCLRAPASSRRRRTTRPRSSGRPYRRGPRSSRRSRPLPGERPSRPRPPTARPSSPGNSRRRPPPAPAGRSAGI